MIFICQIGSAKPQFKKGHYIDISEKKIEGYILYRFDHKKWFKFKSDINAEPIKVKPKECRSFVLYEDENNKENKFEILYNFPIKAGVWKLTVEADFAEVFERGAINLYKHYTIVGSPGPMTTGAGGTMHFHGGGSQHVENLLLKKGENGIIVRVPPKSKKKFRKRVAPLFSDDEELKDLFDKKKATYDGLQSLIQQYNTRHKKTSPE